MHNFLCCHKQDQSCTTNRCMHIHIQYIHTYYIHIRRYKLNWRLRGGSLVQQNEARHTQRALQKWRVYIVQAAETSFKAKIIKCGRDIYLLKWKTLRPVYKNDCACMVVSILMQKSRCHSDKIMCLSKMFFFCLFRNG